MRTQYSNRIYSQFQRCTLYKSRESSDVILVESRKLHVNEDVTLQELCNPANQVHVDGYAALVLKSSGHKVIGHTCIHSLERHQVFTLLT